MERKSVHKYNTKRLNSDLCIHKYWSVSDSLRPLKILAEICCLVSEGGLKVNIPDYVTDLQHIMYAFALYVFTLPFFTAHIAQTWGHGSQTFMIAHKN